MAHQDALNSKGLRLAVPRKISPALPHQDALNSKGLRHHARDGQHHGLAHQDALNSKGLRPVKIAEPDWFSLIKMP